MAGVERVTGFRTSNAITRAIWFVYEHGSRRYNFKGLYFHKTRYRGREEKVYGATRTRLPYAELLKAFQLCNVIF